MGPGTRLPTGRMLNASTSPPSPPAARLTDTAAGSATMVSRTHKVRICTEYLSVCLLVGIGTLPPPLSPASVPLPPGARGVGAHSPAG